MFFTNLAKPYSISMSTNSRKIALLIAQLIFLVLFAITFTISLLQLAGNKRWLSRLDSKNPEYNQKEAFDRSLGTINSLAKLEKYCDSIFSNETVTEKEKNYPQEYANLLAELVRKRFYHGYSSYGFENNYMAVVLSRLSRPGYNSIVEPDDILKYPFAACSQQSIVMMEVLKKKGMKTRSVLFQGKKSGHFAFELFYENNWHFFDPNMEPDLAILNNYNRPSISFLTTHPDILLSAYRHYPKDLIEDVFFTYSYGNVNSFPAPRAAIFHKLSKLLSETAWIIFLILFLVFHRKYLRLSDNHYVRNRWIYFPSFKRGRFTPDYPGITTPGA